MSDQIDPAWWSGAFDSSSADPEEPPELLSSALAKLAQAADPETLQRRVLDALTIATSPMLVPDNWLEPFEPAMRWGNRRSALPSDLNPAQLELLAQAAPLITQPTLQARVADIAWTYGDRRRGEMLDLAVDAYRKAPLTPHSWASIGKDSWVRAFELIRRRGQAGQLRVEAMVAVLQERLAASTVADRFMVIGLSELLRAHAAMAPEQSQPIAEHLSALAAAAETESFRLARHLEREAIPWFLKAGDTDATNQSRARIAQRYVAEADARLAADPSGPLVAGHFLERAIATIKQIPRSYRQSKGLDVRLAELRARLAETRETSLEFMMRIESDPMDLTTSVAQARRRVSGRSKFEALAVLCSLLPLTDAEQAKVDAREHVESSLARLFGRATFAHDGRKVAASSGGLEDHAAVASEAIRNFGVRTELSVVGLLLPAQEVVTFEHHFRLEDLVDICVESPSVPMKHVGLWARGLWHGLNGDYPSAISLLVPQLEQFVRLHLKAAGVHTLFVDDETGVETEKGLGSLLELPEASATLGADLCFELRVLLTEQEGANLRNHVAHGLLTDGESWSAHAAYAWWLAMRIAVIPLWNARNFASDEQEPTQPSTTQRDGASADSSTS